MDSEFVSQRLRIALVAPEFPPQTGGMETYALNLASALARAGNEVEVFAQDNAEPFDYSDFRLVRGLKLRRRHDMRLFDGHSPDVWHVLNAGYAWLASHKSPVFASVHGNDFLSPWVMSERLDLRTRLGVPFVTRADLFLGRRWSRQAVDCGFDMVRHTFANSRYSESAFLQRYPQCRGKTSVAYVGVSSDFGVSTRRVDDRKEMHSLITVCRLSEARKNVDVVLRALALLKPQFRFQYTVIGDGSLRPELEGLARKLGIDQNVRFAGRVSDQELRRSLSASDLFILTSGISSTSFEGFGIVYLEANASGVPVLAAKCGGAVEAVADGKSGWFVDEITPERIAGELARFFRGEIRFDAQACREFAGQFHWDNVCRHIVAKYEEAVAMTAMS